MNDTHEPSAASPPEDSPKPKTRARRRPRRTRREAPPQQAEIAAPAAPEPATEPAEPARDESSALDPSAEPSRPAPAEDAPEEVIVLAGDAEALDGELDGQEAAAETTEVAEAPTEDGAESTPASTEAAEAERPTRPRRRRRGRRGRGRGGKAAGPDEPAAHAETEVVPAPAAKPAGKPAPAREELPEAGEQTEEDLEAQAAEEEAAAELSGEVPDVSHGKVMLVNIAEGDECRIAMLEGGQLQEFYVERTASLSHVGNIYKGVVTNIEPSIQAAFVDFGEGKNGFLHISDLQPQYFPGGGHSEDVGRKTPRRDRPPIQKCLRRGQDIVVQVTKEGIGTKGATLTTYSALPGRYLVMMPGMSRLGVSRKIEDDDARRRMRDVLNQLELPKDMGFILRTAGLDRTKRELQQDLNYLVRLWKQILRRKNSVRAPAELYRESDLVTRTLRDVVTPDVQQILIDDETVAEQSRQFLRLLSPRLAERVAYYSDSEPIFYKYGVEDEVARIHSKRVPLKSGGSLVIESTEALVAIDVNSGKFREAADPEESAYRINLEAAEEIARQLSLRDLGGVIICDFIDMHMERHRREIERALREALKKHKERAEILRMSRFGIIEMTRQRQRPSITRSMLVDCTHCAGGGMIKSPETVMLEAVRAIRTAVAHPDVVRVEVKVDPHVAQMLLNAKRRVLAEIESRTGRTVVVTPTVDLPGSRISITCLDSRGWAVQVALPKSLQGSTTP